MSAAYQDAGANLLALRAERLPLELLGPKRESGRCVILMGFIYSQGVSQIGSISCVLLHTSKYNIRVLSTEYCSHLMRNPEHRSTLSFFEDDTSVMSTETNPT